MEMHNALSAMDLSPSHNFINGKLTVGSLIVDLRNTEPKPLAIIETIIETSINTGLNIGQKSAYAQVRGIL